MGLRYTQTELKQLIAKHLPQLNGDEFSAEQWSALQMTLQTLPAKRLSHNLLVYAVSRSFGVSPEQFAKPTRPMMDRQVKKRPAESETNPPFHIKFFKKEPLLTPHTPLIWEPTSQNGPLNVSLKPYNVRNTALKPTSPENGYQSVMATPGDTKVYPVFQNFNGTLFKALTPLGPKQANGQIHPTTPTKTDNTNSLPIHRPKPMTFHATLDKLIQHTNKPRWPSNKQLTGATAYQIFSDHDHQNTIQIRGIDCHWYHLIAHFLGGEQSRSNLIPSTAAANYNTLEIVEQFIADLLIKQKTKDVTICVTPFYQSAGHAIPSQIQFELEWIEGSAVMKKETININPRSFRRIGSNEKQVIELFRKGPLF